MQIIKTIIFTITSLLTMNDVIMAMCKIHFPGRNHIPPKADILLGIFDNASRCPESVNELKKLLEIDGLKTFPSIVANRGLHNPTLGSFSIFETTDGFSHSLQKKVKSNYFFFGHFTKLNAKKISLDQDPTKNKLLVEIIAWDIEKNLYNFYELRGKNSTNISWYYRGDSTDALGDNNQLHRQNDPDKPFFGKRMRCSACHVAGGPIMKEIYQPYNDWWQEKRKLIFHPNTPSADFLKILSKVKHPSFLAEAVISGAEMLENSKNYQKAKITRNYQSYHC
ncbi:MAG: hypothetical protein AB8G05_05400 [Oligoflexales bacterium]